MSARASVGVLPDTVRHALERRLVESGFADYTELADWLQAEGYQISRSAVHRYGQKVERRFASIKASTEAHAQAHDCANDDLRVDGRDIKAKVLGEGGNLGTTQLGRIEDWQAGGRCCTGAIDNSAGVDCSDHE